MKSRVGVLPKTWCEATISEITSVNPTRDKAGIPDDLEVSFVPMPAVQANTGVMDVSGLRKFSEVKKGYTPFREEDVLFAKITPCMENGKMAVVPEVRNGIGFGSTEFHVLRALLGVNARYVYYYVSSQAFRREAEHNMSGAVGQRRVTTPYLSACEVPLPPTNEQHRIVAKIEELFSELDKGIENLKTARAQLKVYRQALLKHAFEGKLTAQWRMERHVTPAKAGVQPLNDLDSRLRGNDEMVETAAALHKRIQQERAQRYQQQLADWEAAGKQGSKPKAPKPLPPLTAAELAELPELPEGWGWFKLADLSDISGGLTKNQKRNTLPIRRPFLRVGNVYANRLELGDMHDTGVSEAEIERVTLVKGDILVVEGNGSVDQIGRVAIWNGAIEGCVHQNHLIKSRPLDLVLSEFILYFLMSELGRKFIVRAASSTSGLHTLSISKVEGLFVPFCMKEEQEILLCELSSKLSLTDQLDQTITTALQQAEALRQSILKKAFSGQLVSQDPHDEPASRLLARIRAERADTTPRETKQHRTRKVIA